MLRDTSEKEGHGWHFGESEFLAGTKRANLYTGDYSLDGYYDSKCLAIERKGTAAELAANLSRADLWANFRGELERLEEFAHPFVVCEFPYRLMETYPAGSGLPASVCRRIRVKPAFLVKRLWEIQLAFKTKFVFAGGPARDAVASLFKRVMERCPPPSPGG